MSTDALSPRSFTDALPYSAQLCIIANAKAKSGDRAAALAAYAEAADQALGMVWCCLMTGGEPADVTEISAMRKRLRVIGRG